MVKNSTSIRRNDNRVLVCLIVGLMLNASPLAAAPAAGAATVHQLEQLKLNPYAVYQVHDREISLPNTSIVFERGVIAFTEEADGKVTGAFFVGEGEVLVHPPSDPARRQVERESLALFTGGAILDQHFQQAYFCFSDDAPFRWRLGSERGDGAFAQRWTPVAQELGRMNSLALASAMLNQQTQAAWGPAYLHARFFATGLGTFDLVLDNTQEESLSLSQTREKFGQTYTDTWMRFPLGGPRVASVRLSDFAIDSVITPDGLLRTTATINVDAAAPGLRVVTFELARELKVSEVQSPGRPLAFLQNESLEGSELARHGNDSVTVIFDEPLPLHHPVPVRFQYAGRILSDAGNGLNFLRARGVWYPNRGPQPADFDLRFTHPAGWSVLATGDPVTSETTSTFSHWTATAIPLAGFNVGEYRSLVEQAGPVTVEAYAARGIETRNAEGLKRVPALGMPGIALDPNRSMKRVATDARQSLNSMASLLGPLPWTHLAITQQPGAASQGWPGLIFLSSLAYMGADEPLFASRELYGQALYGKLMLAHEVAHQWWGDRVGWRSERDVWLIEALANQTALLQLESHDPRLRKTVLDFYRTTLLEPRDVDGKKRLLREAGPVTIGSRLNSSKFPDGYDAVAYARGTWLLHMLRSLLREYDSAQPDARFLQVLRSLAASPDRLIGNDELKRLCEGVLDPKEGYEGHRSLDWFFGGWVNGSAVPKLTLRGVRLQRNQRAMVATAELLQEEAPAELVTPVPVYADLEDQPPLFLGRVYAETGSTPVRLRVPPQTRGLLLDPFDDVLRRK